MPYFECPPGCNAVPVPLGSPATTDPEVLACGCGAVPDEAASWAHRCLPDKNTLRAADAGLVGNIQADEVGLGYGTLRRVVMGNQRARGVTEIVDDAQPIRRQALGVNGACQERQTQQDTPARQTKPRRSAQ